jgi:hypothetical protein
VDPSTLSLYRERVASLFSLLRRGAIGRVREEREEIVPS